MRLPDPVLVVPEEERRTRTWGSEQALMQVQGTGAFVRVMLPIQLTDGYTLTVGTWLAIDPAKLNEVWEIWDTNRYKDLSLDGYLANSIAPWGQALLGAPATARVRNPAENPYVDSSPDPTLQRVLSEQWPHNEVLEPYESL
jgi:hypothetical protein